MGIPGGASGKALASDAGDIRDLGLIPGLAKSSGGGDGYPLQYSWLENPMDRRAWRHTVHGFTKSWTLLKWLNTHSCSVCKSQGSHLESSGNKISVTGPCGVGSTFKVLLLKKDQASNLAPPSFKNISLFIWLHQLLVVAHGISAGCRISNYGIWTLSCSMWDLAPWPGIKPWPLALGAWRLSHWTSREVPGFTNSVSYTISSHFSVFWFSYLEKRDTLKGQNYR